MTLNRDLQERVLKALEFEPSVDAAHIGVTAHDGVVTLQGSVGTYMEKWAAERAASRVYGVRGLANDIVVVLTGASQPSDTAIAEAAVHTLFWDSAVPVNAVQVTVDQGWVSLTGVVEWRFQRDAAEAAVRRLTGVKGIINAVNVRPHVRPVDIKEHIQQAFERSAVVDAQGIQVEVRHGQVTLTGTVRSLHERREAERAAWAVPGVTLVDDRIAVSA